METVEKWYGKRMERPTRARARVVAQARAGQAAALTNLLALARTETHSVMARGCHWPAEALV